jgi:hypothetical protein
MGALVPLQLVSVFTRVAQHTQVVAHRTGECRGTLALACRSYVPGFQDVQIWLVQGKIRCHIVHVILSLHSARERARAQMPCSSLQCGLKMPCGPNYTAPEGVANHETI